MTAADDRRGPRSDAEPLEPATRADPVEPDPSRRPDRVVLLGASAGGVEALQRVVRNLPAGFPAPIVVVLHVPSTAFSRLPDILARTSLLDARHVTDGDRLLPGTIFVAPPDRHVICADHRLSLVEGPRENGVRPAIDPLFRSAARAIGAGVIAGVLSGTLDDGTAGIAAVHAHGGVTIAQEPSDAICPAMPQSAIENATVDYVVAADDFGDLLSSLVARREEDVVPQPRRRAAGSKATDLVCPECGGVLRQFEDNGVFRFHCRVGHNYSPEALYGAQDQRLEAALWAAIRSLEESASMARRLANAARDRGAKHTARRFDDREREAAQRADLIRSAILSLSDLDDTPTIGEAQPVASEDDARRPVAAGADATRD
jgi:two-component system, chemotaxis family, protein-glutamate methylesterase/glutaminase